MKAEELYEIEEIAPDTYRIREGGFMNAYLLLGSRKALLIDTCLGAGDIRQAVRSVTQLPLEVAVTHGHCDHLGGAGRFGGVFIHPADMAPVYRFLSSRFAARAFAVISRKRYPFPGQPKKKNLLPLDPEREFDLGGRTIGLICGPGHTRGSTAYIDRENRLIFAGDNYAPGMLLMLPGAAPLQEWYGSMKRFYEMAEGYRVFWGHRSGVVTREQQKSLLMLGGRVLLDRKKNAFPGIVRAVRDDEQKTFIVYNTGHIYSRKRG